MAKSKSKPAGGAIDVTKLRRFVDGHAALLQKRADIAGEIKSLLSRAEDSGYNKKAIETTSKRKSKNRTAVYAQELQVREYEVALGLATQDMFDEGPGEPDAAEDAKAEARDDPPPRPTPKALPKPSEITKQDGNGKPSSLGAADFPLAAGKRAARAGWAPSQNPYKNEKEAKASWAKGFEDETKAMKAEEKDAAKPKKKKAAKKKPAGAPAPA